MILANRLFESIVSSGCRFRWLNIAEFWQFKPNVLGSTLSLNTFSFSWKNVIVWYRCLLLWLLLKIINYIITVKNNSVYPIVSLNNTIFKNHLSICFASYNSKKKNSYAILTVASPLSPSPCSATPCKPLPLRKSLPNYLYI